MNSGRLLHLCLGCVFATVVAVIYIPIATVSVAAFFPVAQGRITFTEPTLNFFTSLFLNSSVMDALYNSVITASVSTVISLTAATIYAGFLRNKSAAIRSIFEILIYAPFFLPPIIVGLSLLLASSAIGMTRGLGTIVLGHSLFTLAIVYRIISMRLATLPQSQLHASADLGASRVQTLRFITVPHLGPAFIASGLLSILLSFDETLITSLIAGNTTTLPLRLWAMMRVGFSPSINALVVFVLGICILLSLAVVLIVARAAGHKRIS